jgi:hypothetical protein
MRPTWREIHNLALVNAKDAMDAAFEQQRQVGERTETTVAHEHVTEHEHGMEPDHVGHVMGVQRAGQNFQKHPGAGVEEGEDVGDRETAAGPLAGGLAEMGLEFGRVGHRERGAIDVEDAMAKPATGVAGGGEERIGDAAEQDLEDRER